MSKQIVRILISLLSVIALATGCAAFAYAEGTPVGADGYKLVEHDDKSHDGSVIFDTKQSYVSAMAVCSYRNNEKQQECYFYGHSEIFLFIDDLFSIYDGTPHGVHFGWKRNYGDIQRGFPNSSDAPGCRQKTEIGYWGKTASGEDYADSAPPTLPGEYYAGSQIQFEGMMGEHEDVYALKTSTYTIEQKELVLSWGDETEFLYDGKPHAPTVEIAPGQIVEGDEVNVTASAETDTGEHTATAELTGRDSWKYKINDRTLKKNYTIVCPYDLQFDANVPETASTKQFLEGTMQKQHFDYGQEQELTTNAYVLPGYEFVGWNTKPDYSGTHYDDGQRVSDLTKTEATVTLYAEWRNQTYNILFKAGNGDLAQKHIQQNVFFDTPGELEKYTTMGWTPPENHDLHGWIRDGAAFGGSFYKDGARFLNLCERDANGAPLMDSEGNIVGATLIADWIYRGQIAATVTLDNTPQEGLEKYFRLVSDQGATFTPPFTFDKDRGKYVYDPQNLEQDSARLPLGEYDLVFDTEATGPGEPLYRFAPASIHIHYGEASAVSTVFDYYTLTVEEDPAYEDFHNVDMQGGRLVSEKPKKVVAREGSKVRIDTTVDPGYHFERYTVSGFTPVDWEPEEVKQNITVRGATEFMAHIGANVYTVKFNANASSGVSGKMEDQDMVYGEPQNLFANKFKRADADFTGWNTKKNGSGTAYKDRQRVQNLITKDGGTVTLYAQWKTKKKPTPPAKASGILLAKLTAKGSKSLTVSWNRVKGAKGYEIFFARCDGKGRTTTKKVKTVKAGKPLKWTRKGLKKKKAYKVYVKAYTVKNGKKKYIKSSPLMHAYTSGASKKYTNAKAVTVKKTKVTLKKGKTFKIKAKVVKLKKNKKLMPRTHVPTLRYISSNKKVATVSKAGKITAKARGTCKIYVYAHNGVCKTIKITVK